MNLEQLNARFSNEAHCMEFFEAARRPNGRICHTVLSQALIKSMHAATDHCTARG